MKTAITISGKKVEIEVEEDAIKIPLAVGHRIRTKENLFKFSDDDFARYQKIFGKSNFGEWRTPNVNGVIIHSAGSNFWLVKHDESENCESDYSVYSYTELEDLTARDIVLSALSKPLTDWFENV